MDSGPTSLDVNLGIPAFQGADRRSGVSDGFHIVAVRFGTSKEDL
jgi:hypothetical protein